MNPIKWLAMGTMVALGAGCYQDRNQSIELMNEGVQAAQQKLYDTAERKLKEATVTYPANEQAWFNLGVVYKDQKKWPEAADAFSHAAKQQDDNAEYHYELAQALQESGKLDEAKPEYEKTLALNPRLYKAHARFGDLLRSLGNQKMSQDLLKEADAEYRKALAINSRFIDAYIRLGGLYKDHGYAKEAIEVFQAAALADDTSAEAHHEMALALQEDKQYDEAIKEMQKAIQRTHQAFDMYFDLGMIYKAKYDAGKDLGDKKSAKEWLQKFTANSGGKITAERVKAAQNAIFALDAQ